MIYIIKVHFLDYNNVDNIIDIDGFIKNFIKCVNELD